MTRIVLFGPSGQVGRALQDVYDGEVIPVSRLQCDLAEPGHIAETLSSLNPELVINAAAYTKVDMAESEDEMAFAINALAPGAMAHWCRIHNVPLVHYSTDYVFDGEGDTPWREEDVPDPQNVYGASKLEGERRVIEENGRYLIFRTSWVYDALGDNFLNSMLERAAEQSRIKVVQDQWGAPTYAPYIALATRQALAMALQLPSFPSGLYHMTCAGSTNWHGFAGYIFTLARAFGMKILLETVEGVTTDRFETPARRPLNSRLNCRKISRDLGVVMPDWHSGVHACMEVKKQAEKKHYLLEKEAEYESI